MSANARGDAARLGELDHDAVVGLPHGVEVVQRQDRLVGEQRHVRPLLEPQHALRVRRRQRLLDELGVEILEDREGRRRPLAVPPLVGVVAERHVRQLELESARQLQVAVEPELDLERAERGGGARLRQHVLRRGDGDGVRGPDRRTGEPEHPPDGLAGLLAGEVPGGGAQAGPQGRHAAAASDSQYASTSAGPSRSAISGARVVQEADVPLAALAVAGVRRAFADADEVALPQLDDEPLELAVGPAGDAERSRGAQVEARVWRRMPCCSSFP